jgi:quinoprotein glucose dehydrogenase
VGAVFMDNAQTGSPMTYVVNGRQHIVVASAGYDGGELICYRLPTGAIAAATASPP